MQRSAPHLDPSVDHVSGTRPCGPAVAGVVHLRNGGTSVVIDIDRHEPRALPVIVHWGEDLGDADPTTLQHLATATLTQRVSGGLDRPARVTLLPQESAGWQGTPGLLGSRNGRSFSPAFSTTETAVSPDAVTVWADDAETALSLRIDLSLDAAGVLSQVLTLTNTGDDDYELDELHATLPVPASAGELHDTTGRHLRERAPQRHEFTVGRHLRDGRKGRPGADATLLLCAGTPGFDFSAGLVHGVHLAWSGNSRIAAERLVSGAALLQAGELLSAGEMRLAPGASYSTPRVIGSWGHGLGELSARLHDSVRARPQHPSSPRPVTLNTWEAVYFDHDLDRLLALAEAAATVGVERYVLDDGWFRGRRDDTAGLGDWFVDETVWPDGLSPLVERVTALGMQFGLWVEPEMVNEDSDLAREHPDWLLQSGSHGRLPEPGRQQQVLDLSHPEAFAYIAERLDALLDEYPISYLKWDHNRDLLDAGSTRTGRPAVHANVQALYRLLDGLRERHPGLEIESCASGGARVDLGILDHTDRIWASDCIDPIERLTIQRYTGLLVPYELIGAHIGGPVSHSTGRTSSLAFRAATALFGHLGIEWDITAATNSERAELADWVAYHRRHRALFHAGRAVHVELPDASMDLRGVVSTDRERAVFVFTQVATSASYPAGPLRFTGLDDDRLYRIAAPSRLGAAAMLPRSTGQSPLAWLTEPITLTGRMLRTVGVQAPVLFPETPALIEITAVTD
ncbi:alpha-galactosidase [Plantibacter flavus]|uniref:alpha-galactosidase n=1 Tax=Plantibacter flavus TaxID=150123 RepID=UPI003F15B3E2